MQNKAELLVLDRPEIPLHTNGSENDIRAFLGLAKTCDKLGVPFWDYLGDRLAGASPKAVPYLPQLVSQRCPAA